MSTKAFSKKTLFGTTIIAGFAALTVAGTAAAQTAPTAPARNGVCEPTVANDPDCGPIVNNPTGAPQTPAGSTDAEPATQGGNLPSSTDTSEEEPGVNTPDGDAEEVEAVVVTGSRIRRTDFTSATPVQVITSEQATLEGLVDTAEILQQSTVAAGSFQTNDQLTGFVTQGGGGVNTVSLRGLGSERTLVILNGRRLGPAGVRGQVQAIDLGTIPQSLIARQEILTSGASSIYGSDAIAGVINLITRDNIDGVELLLSGTIPLDDGGETYRASATFGKRFETRNAYFNVSLDYFENKPLTRGDREDTSCTADYLFFPQADGSGSAGGRRDYSELNGGFKCYNLLSNVLRTTPFGDLQYNKPGVVYPNAAGGNNSTIVGMSRQARAGFPDTYPYANFGFEESQRATVISPAKRYTATAFAGFDLTETAQVYGELLLNRRESEQLGVRQLFQSVVATNVNNVRPDTGALFGITTQPIIALNSDREQQVDYVRGLIGIRGDLPDFGTVTGLNFDLYGQFSRSDGTYTDDAIYNDRVLALTGSALACNPNPAGGNLSNFSCASLPNGIPWTSARILAGDFTAEEAAFLFFRDTGNTIYDHMYVEGVLSASSLFTLPAGPLGAAVGFQIRKEEIDDQPGNQTQIGNLYGSTSAGRTAGSDTVREIFGEMEIPVLRGIPLFEDLSFNVSGRYSNYDSYGDSTTYKATMNWQVVDFLRLRASQGTSFRAPALFELFLANQTGFLGQASVDPCINYQDSTNQVLAANCASLGIPPGYTAAGSSSALIITGGGAGILDPETAESRGFGFVLTPKFADISLAVDYFEIEIEDEVRTFGAGNIANQCLSSADFPNNPFCSLIVRGAQTPGGVPYAIISINNSYVNVASQKNRGIDASIRYRRELPFGDLTVDGRATWQLQDTVNLLGGTEEDFNGSTFNFDGPDFSGEANVRLDVSDYTFNWAMNFIGKGSDTENFGGDVFNSTRYANTPGGQPVYYKQYVEQTTYHSFSVRRRYNDFNFLVGLSNAFDERPPAQSAGQFRSGTAALNAYDIRGRRLFFNIGKTF